jgi:PAS domain S-box-containing protein
MKTTGASENPTRSTRSSRIKWHHLYFLLAAFAVFTVSFSLVLIHRLVATHKRAVEGNFQWVARLQLCDNLGKNAAVVAASGTDALKQHDPDAAALKMRGAFSDFSEKLNSLRDEMNRNVPPTDAAQLLRHCATVRKEIGDVVERSDSIFSLVRTGKFDEAGKQGVTLSRDYNDVLEELNRFRVDIRAVRKTYMEAQTIEASKLAAYEWWLGGLILVLVAGITIYGVKLERHMSIAAARLRESEERYRTLFDSIDEGFCIIEMIFDEQGKPVDYRFLEISPSFEKQTGLIGAQGKRMRELAPQHEAYWFEIYGRIALTGQPGRFQNRAEQLHRWYDVYAFRFGDPKNRQVAILFNDITERRRDEEKILKLNDELARQAAQLEAANKELEAFSYSVSHDMRAPVRYIDGFADLLQKHSGASLNEKGRRYLNTISESAKQMGALINDLFG